MAKRRRRGNGEGSIYQRSSDGAWVAAFFIEGRRVVVYSDSARGAREKMADTRAAAARGELVGRPAAGTLSEFLARWLRDAAPLRCTPKTLRTYADYVRLHVEPVDLAAAPLRKLSTAQVSSFLVALQEKQVARGARMVTLSPSTVHAVFRMLRAALNTAVEWRVIGRNPVAGVRMPAPGARARSAALLSAQEARALLAAVAGHRLEALISLAVSTGMRQGELLGLRLADIDIEARRVYVRQQRQGGALVDPKSGSARSLLLPAFVVDRLRAHLAQRADDETAAGTEWRESGFLFATGIGTPMGARNLLRDWFKVRASIGRPDLRFHDLRHSAATILHAAGVPSKAIQHLLGHQSERTTADVYLHVTRDSETAAADTMDSLIG